MARTMLYKPGNMITCGQFAVDYVIVDDEEGFVKKISIDEDTVTLRSFNPHYPPRVFGGVEIGRLRFVGRVMELKRRFA